jgi:hypothetical protein
VPLGDSQDLRPFPAKNFLNSHAAIVSQPAPLCSHESHARANGGGRGSRWPVATMAR